MLGTVAHAGCADVLKALAGALSGLTKLNLASCEEVMDEGLATLGNCRSPCSGANTA